MPGRGRRRWLTEPFVMITRDMLFECQEWKTLSPGAKLFYIYLKAKFNGMNNGEIGLHYQELRGVKGLSSSTTIARAIRELETGGWISITQHGGLYRYNNDFLITGTYDIAFPSDRRG